MTKAHAGRGERPIFLKPGHNAGDLVQTQHWEIIEESRGKVRVEVPLPGHLLNPRNQLFGGFTGIFVDMVSIWTVRTLFDDPAEFQWAATVNMRIDYFAPVLGPTFILQGDLVNDGNTTSLVSTTFQDAAGSKLVYAITTMRKNPRRD